MSSKLRLAVVMDRIGEIKYAKDTTLAMLLAAKQRGHELSYLTQQDLYLRDGVARGLLTSDGFQSVRTLMSPRGRWSAAGPRTSTRLRRGARGALSAEGRWAFFPQPAPAGDADALAEAVAEQLLARWGVVLRELVQREVLSIPYRDVLWALRRLEARGTIRGGRFVAGFSGEQYALPEAVELLRKVRREARSGELVRLSACDPLNLVGTLLPGARVPALAAHSLPLTPVLVAGGLVAGLTNGAFAVLLTDLFPTRIRFTGVALVFNIGFTLFSGMAPLVATSLIRETGYDWAPAIFMGACSAIALVGSFFHKRYGGNVLGA